MHTSKQPALLSLPAIAPVWPLFAGLAALYIPTYLDLARKLWPEEEHAHGPIMLAIVLWLAWRQRHALLSGAIAPRAVAGWTTLVVGLLIYAFGRSQDVLVFEVGSQIPVLIGSLLILRGWSAVRALWFPLLFIIFLIPLPGALVDAITGPLKQYVSVLAEVILYAAGYPIARTGVILSVGQYQLLVADACSGLNSMYSLSALGLLYLHLMQHTSLWRNAILLAAILPIAFAANVVRVILLALITYHFGDEAGQGFMHGFAGIILLIAAIVMLWGLDGTLGWINALWPRIRK